MFSLFQKIQINKYVFTASTSVSVDKSYTRFTDTCIIQLPNVLFKNKNEAVGQAVSGETLINKGDPVKVWAGYDKQIDELPLLFTGFVTNIDADENLVIKCEDYTYALKLVNIESNYYEDATIKELISSILTGSNITVKYIIPETTKIGNFKIENTNYLNIVDVLEKLKEDLGITSYFDGTTLKIGKFIDVNDNQINLIFQYNIVSSGNLVYNKASDINQVIKGVSILESNEKIEKYAYLQNGELQISGTPVKGEQLTKTFYNITESELEQVITDNFQNYVYTGYSGNFDTFLEPKINVSDKVKLFNLQYPERNGTYKVRSVQTNIDNNGAFQTVELDYRVG